MAEPANISAEIGKAVIKKALLAHLKVPLLIGAGVLFLACMIGALIFTFTFTQPEEQSGSGGWKVGDISSFGAQDIPAEYIPIYKAAGEKYGVPWNLLAAHHRVETKFSTIKVMVSPVGAIGHMQFMKLTWLGWAYPGNRLGDSNVPDSILTSPAMIKEYGGYGVDADGDGRADPMNLKDSIYSAAKYLAANGAADGNLKKAILAYNHSTEYLNEVLGFADLYVKGYKAVEIGASPQIINGAAWPVPGTMQVTSPFGPRIDPVYGGLAFHAGIDIAGPGVNGKPTVSMAAGTIQFAGVQGGYGNTVVVDNGNGTTTLYGHLSSINTTVGTKVKAGSVIGRVGTTGKSTGPHLHFGIQVNGQWVDPAKYLSKFKFIVRS